MWDFKLKMINFQIFAFQSWYVNIFFEKKPYMLSWYAYFVQVSWKNLNNMYLGLCYSENVNRTKDHQMGNFCNGVHIMRDFSHKMRNFIKIVFWKQFSVLKGNNGPKFELLWMKTVEWIIILNIFASSRILNYVCILLILCW